ncbi:TRAP transporter large permease [Vibrio kanaloae]|uniref:TRAP transporter large permease protein n=1 Tax=Vibrio kanaloae TaxID=170673 RepID=A0A4V5RJP4_9VIBR|nr:MULTISPECIES: TRAP transporter large permease [Vibrio]MCF7353006.1 TRAP transporter large permease [Vibrio sp. CK2-1]TKE97498.1 TRAP transporter large permease [Vibrio kanaloae]TKF17040.1 TRAP transporter large permease [Vibrio kanaloae]TKF37277.1 TRAP transporter large permease [Vibrio kanaloae]TKF78768.1 TRAP transporter large permease [Vibrio kanaloae]
MMSPVFLIYFLALLVIGVPVIFTLGLSPIISLFQNDQMLFANMLYQRLYSGLDSFLLLALPFFMLAGECMTIGGITPRIIAFSQTMVQHLRGGLGHVVILASTLFGALTGSAVAATSAIGGMLIPEMKKYNYDTGYAAALTAAATVLGNIIPPSGIMLLYAFVMNTSVSAMFLSGVTPGIIFCLGLMVMNRYQIRKYPSVQSMEKAPAMERNQAFKLAILPLMTPIIILGGIYGGVFTPTEAAAVAVAYSIFVSIFIIRATNIKVTYALFAKVAVNAASILIIIAAASGFASVISLSGVSGTVADFMVGITDNPYLLFAIINVLLFVIGMFLDAGPAILIFAPIFAPIMISAGVDPVHFGVVMTANLSIGLTTPPMGLVLFVASGVSKVPISEISKKIIPFLFVEMAIIFVISCFPQLVIGLPKLVGIM